MLGTAGSFSLSVSDSRRDFLSKGAATAAAVVTGSTFGVRSSSAAPEILTTSSGIKYAVLKPGTTKGTPQKGDIVAIEYTGYLSDGKIFDATHAEGKKNILMFELGGNGVVDGLNDLIENMEVGQKVQAIIPPEKAFGDKGICLESGECLVKPKSTLVYDVLLKRSGIPPP